MAWQTKNKPTWYIQLLIALWNDLLYTWNSTEAAWDAGRQIWQHRNKPTWYTKP